MNRSFITIAAIALAPCVALAQGQSSTDTTRAGAHDSAAMTGHRAQRAGVASDTTVSSATGSISTGTSRRASSANRRAGLTAAQVRQLQQAINDAGCHAGPVDGQLGHQTEQGIQCIREKKGLTGNSAGELYQALGLSFGAQAGNSTISSEGAIYSGAGSANGTANVNGEPYQTGGKNAGRIRPTADSAAQNATTPPSARAAQRGHGMHDSTTSSDTTMRDTTSLNQGTNDSSMMRDTSTTQGEMPMSDTSMRRDSSASRDTSAQGSMRDTTMSPTRSDTGMTGAARDSLSTGTSTGDVTRSDTTTPMSDTSDSRRVSPPSVSGSVAPPHDTTLTVSPLDSSRMGVPQTRDMNHPDSARSDSARTQSDTTRPPR